MKMQEVFIIFLFVSSTTTAGDIPVKQVIGMLPHIVDRTAWGALIIGYWFTEYQNSREQKKQEDKTEENELVPYGTNHIILNKTSLISVDRQKTKKDDTAWKRMLEKSSTISGLYLLARLLKELYFPT